MIFCLLSNLRSLERGSKFVHSCFEKPMFRKVVNNSKKHLSKATITNSICTPPPTATVNLCIDIASTASTTNTKHRLLLLRLYKSLNKYEHVHTYVCPLFLFELRHILRHMLLLWPTSMHQWLGKGHWPNSRILDMHEAGTPSLARQTPQNNKNDLWKGRHHISCLLVYFYTKKLNVCVFGICCKFVCNRGHCNDPDEAFVSLPSVCPTTGRSLQFMTDLPAKTRSCLLLVVCSLTFPLLARFHFLSSVASRMC